MTTVTKRPEKLKALTVVKPTLPPAPPTTQEVMVRVSQALMQLGGALAQVRPEQYGEVLTTIKSFEGVLEAAQVNLDNKIKALVQANGKVETEKGTKRLEVGGYTLGIVPTRTGYDPKRVEALLRAKGHQPDVGMDPVITYRVNETRLKGGVALGQLTEDELETCRYDLKFKVEVTKAKEEQDE